MYYNQETEATYLGSCLCGFNGWSVEETKENGKIIRTHKCLKCGSWLATENLHIHDPKMTQTCKM